MSTKPIVMPDFSTWSRENLERFAREAFAKLAEAEKAKRVPVLNEPLNCGRVKP